MIAQVFKYLKHRPILRRWIVIGLTIICLTGLMLIASALFMVRKLYIKEQTLQENVADENMALLDNSFEEVVLGAQTLISNDLVTAASRKGDETVEDRMRLADISRLINEYMAVHTSFSKMYLIFPKADFGVLTELEYIHIKDNLRMLSGIDLQAQDSDKLFSDNLYSAFKIIGRGADKQLYYSMATQYKTPLEDQDAVLLIRLDLSELRSRIDSGYTFFLIADDGEYIKIGSEEFSDEFISQCISCQAKETVDGRIIYPHNRNSFGIKLVSVMDRSIALGQIRPFILGVIVYGIALILIAAGLLVYCLRRQYRPIEEIISFMEKNEVVSSKDRTRDNDEFKQIENGIDRSIRMLQKSSKDYFEYINDNATRLIKLLNDGIDILEPGNKDDYRYLVVSYDIDNPTGEPFEQKDRDMVWFIIHNVSEELLGKENLLISGGLAHWFYNIIELDGVDDITLGDLTSKLNSVCTFIREKYDIALVSNISDIHHGKKGLIKGNSEAMLVREYRIYVGQLPYVAYYKELSLDDDAKATLTSWDQMEQIQNMYRMHRGLEAQGMLDNMVGKAVKNTIKNTIKTNDIQDPSMENSGKSTNIAEKARQYVDTYYADKNMNVNSIADELGVNNSYLSRTFKQVYGSGMLEYINNVRLDKAKELMEEGFTVKDAADKVGFATPRPLIRCFREKYGTTPGDYYKYK